MRSRFSWVAYLLNFLSAFEKVRLGRNMYVPMQEHCGKFLDETFPKSKHFWVVNQDLDQPNDLLSKSKGDTINNFTGRHEQTQQEVESWTSTGKPGRSWRKGLQRPHVSRQPLSGVPWLSTSEASLFLQSPLASLKQLSTWMWSPEAAWKTEAGLPGKRLCIPVDVSKLQHSCFCFLCWLKKIKATNQPNKQKNRVETHTVTIVLWIWAAVTFVLNDSVLLS